MWEPFHTPVEIKHPLFRTLVPALARQRRAVTADMFKLSAKLYEIFLKGKSFVSGTQTFLDVCFSVDLAKISAVGYGPSVAIGFVLQFVGGLFILGLPSISSEDEGAVIKALKERLKNGSEWQSWFYPKVDALSRMIDNRLGVESCAKPSVMIPPNLANEIAELIATYDRYSLEILQALEEHRKYGVKPAIFQDGMLHHSSEAWVVSDIDRKVLAENEMTGFFAQALAWVSLARKSDVKQIGLCTTPVKGEGFSVTGMGMGFPTYLSCCIDRAGELQMLPGGMAPVRDIYKRVGNEALYTLIRYANILRIHDLVVPLTIVQSSPTLPVQGWLPTTKGSIERRVRQLLNPELVLRRIRKLVDERQETALAFDREYDEDEARTRRRIGRHECTEHVRRLPEGHRASPEARRLAAEAGLRLGNGETFVRKHELGAGELKRLPHRAVYRRS